MYGNIVEKRKTQAISAFVYQYFSKQRGPNGIVGRRPSIYKAIAFTFFDPEPLSFAKFDGTDDVIDRLR